jgi:hypothetical protein
MKNKLFNQENLWAFLLAVLIIGLIIMTSSDAPLWIYQGF